MISFPLEAYPCLLCQHRSKVPRPQEVACSTNEETLPSWPGKRGTGSPRVAGRPSSDPLKRDSPQGQSELSPGRSGFPRLCASTAVVRAMCAQIAPNPGNICFFEKKKNDFGYFLFSQFYFGQIHVKRNVCLHIDVRAISCAK